MALEQEAAIRQGDLTHAATMVESVANLAVTAAAATSAAAAMGAELTAAAADVAAAAAAITNDGAAQAAYDAAVTRWSSTRGPLNGPAMGAAEETWNTAAQLAQDHESWLEQRWRHLRQSAPPANPAGYRDPVLDALHRYSEPALNLAALLHSQLDGETPFPATRNITRADATAILTGVSAGLNSLAAAVAETLRDLSWAGAADAAAHAERHASDLLTMANAVAATVNDGVAGGDAALAAALAHLAALRADAWGDPGGPADAAHSRDRVRELDATLAALLDAPAGVGTATPVALLPVRLEVRTAPSPQGGTELRIRVHPDDLHVDSHDPRLHFGPPGPPLPGDPHDPGPGGDETAWADYLTTHAAANPDRDAARAAWAAAADHLGAPRAAYLLHPTRGAGTRTTLWEQPATAACLPRRWLAVAYDAGGAPVGAALSNPVKRPVNVGPDPTVTPTPTPGELPIDAGLAWLVDFQIALDNGMGLRLVVNGATDTPDHLPTFSRLVVVGVGDDDASSLAQLLIAHRYTDGLRVVPPGTATNNTAQSPSAYTGTDPGHAASFHLEVGDDPEGRPAPTGDAARLAAALGVTVDTSPTATEVFAAAGDPVDLHLQQQAMATLCWPATWGHFLTTLSAMSANRAETLRVWATAWVRPSGPLPALLVGNQPYGVLPVVALGAWRDDRDAAAADIHPVVTSLMAVWQAAYRDRLQDQHSLDDILSRTAVSSHLAARFAGLVAGWLKANDSLLSVDPATIEHRVAAAAGWLDEIGTQAALGAPPTWPAGFVVLPDWVEATDPWPINNTDTPVAGADAADYLNRLLAAHATPPPATTVLSALAAAAWRRTPAADRSTATLVPRGDLTAPQPVAPTPSDDLHGAIAYLAAARDADLAALVGGAVDSASHRLDAWATALATCRLAELRNGDHRALAVGGYGWLENLHARPPRAAATVADEPDARADPENAGYLHAPSVTQATTAAVLRSGYLTHNHPATAAAPTAAFAVDLSSRRARLATWLLDGIRQGEPLAALLGYRFERALQDAGAAHLIDTARQQFPYQANPAGDFDHGAVEQAPITDVVDGVQLLGAYQSGALNSPTWHDALSALNTLADSADAVADAVTAQSLHDTLNANLTRAAATLAAVATAAVAAPQLEFLTTPRTGAAVTHRVLLAAPAHPVTPPSGWPATPRGRAEPALDSWAATLLGDPTTVTATVELTDPTGAPLPQPDATVAITLAQLGLGPLDLLAVCEAPTDIERLAVHHALRQRPPQAAPARGGHLHDTPPNAQRPLADILTVARAAARLLTGGRPGDARDATAGGAGPGDPRVDLKNLADRVAGAAADLDAAATQLRHALPDDPPPGPNPPPTDTPAAADAAQLAEALLAAVALGVAGAAPASTAAADLVPQTRAARAEIARRQQQLAAAEPPAGDPPDPQQTLRGRLDQLRAAFGPGFTALPLFRTDPEDLLPKAAQATTADDTNHRESPEAWIYKTARVHPTLADLLDTYGTAEALGAPGVALQLAQLPLGDTAGWAGQSLTATAPPANTLSLAVVPAIPAPGPMAALVVADWVELIPSDTETTAITYHYDAPRAQAPQTILLAVPADRSAPHWNYTSLADTVAAALDLAHVRAVDYTDLPPPAQLLLPAIYLDNAADGTPPLTVDTPANYLTPLPLATITAVDGAPVDILQGATAQLTVRGTELADQTFLIDGVGVTATATSVTPAHDVATVTVTVADDATVGRRSLTVAASTHRDAINIGGRHRIDACDTVALSQQMSPLATAIKVYGQGLTGATATLTASPTVTVVNTATADNVVTVNILIAASAYKPGEDDDGGSQDPPGDHPRGWHPPPGWQPPTHKSGPGRQPEHSNATLTLTVTAGTLTQTFPITLDLIT